MDVACANAETIEVIVPDNRTAVLANDGAILLLDDGAVADLGFVSFDAHFVQPPIDRRHDGVPLRLNDGILSLV